MISGILSRFSLIWPKRKPLPGKQPPLGLSRAQVQGLKDLIPSPNWPAYLAAVEAEAQRVATVVLNGLPNEREYWQHVGYLNGLQVAVDLPSRIIQRTDELTRTNQDKEPERDDPFDGQHLYATPFYRVARRPELPGLDARENGR